jgi:tRNA/rRNA methyltransferase/tRNA (cytidine32/uridine32-2'-O)-methyltransferase
MTEHALARLRVVLVEPQDPINIGATVRAMKNMGVGELRLVRPVAYDPNRIEQVAHDTREIVARIRHHDTLDDAIADSTFVAAFTARHRSAKWTVTTPRALAERIASGDAEEISAFVFGREDRGLDNAALDRAHVHCTIPTTNHASLNLAQAVLVALYELHVAIGDATRKALPPRKDVPDATTEQLERYFQDQENALEAIAFFKTRFREHIMRTVRSIAMRARPNAREIELMRAMSIEVLRTIERMRSEVRSEVRGPRSE